MVKTDAKYSFSILHKDKYPIFKQEAAKKVGHYKVC